MSGGHSRSASASGLGRRSGELAIQEEEEEEEEEGGDCSEAGGGGGGAVGGRSGETAVVEEEEEDIEEVDSFSPIVKGPGEIVEEMIYEEGEEEEGKTVGLQPAAPITPAG